MLERNHKSAIAHSTPAPFPQGRLVPSILTAPTWGSWGGKSLGRFSFTRDHRATNYRNNSIKSGSTSFAIPTPLLGR